VLITRGEKGMSLIEETTPRALHVPATGFEVTYARVGQTGIDRKGNALVCKPYGKSGWPRWMR